MPYNVGSYYSRIVHIIVYYAIWHVIVETELSTLGLRRVGGGLGFRRTWDKFGEGFACFGAVLASEAVGPNLGAVDNLGYTIIVLIRLYSGLYNISPTNKL